MALSETCVFCRIVAGELPAEVVHDSPDALAFRDLAPEAPIHVLVVPKTHAATLAALTATDPDQGGRWLQQIPEVAADLGLDTDGYRVVVNTGDHGGQTVDHLHAHILGGRRMTWPPG
jgi:histidine triad (HIT) family protein